METGLFSKAVEKVSESANIDENYAKIAVVAVMIIAAIPIASLISIMAIRLNNSMGNRRENDRSHGERLADL